MSLARVPVSLGVHALLAMVAGSAHGQAPPTPPVAGEPASAPDAPAAPQAGAPPAPAAPAPASRPTARSPAAAAPGASDLATVQAGIQAKAAGQLIEVTDPAKMAGCRDLGDRYEETSVRGARGRLELRSALKSKGRARGASHVRYSDYAVLDFNGQGERGHFYDCALTGLLPPTPTPGATGAPGRAGASGSTSALVAQGAGAPAASVSAGAGATGTHAPTLMLTGQLELVPVGALQAKLNDQSLETATGMSYGVSGNLEILLTPYLAVGLNPGVTLGLKTDMGTAARKQFDLRARARLGTLAVEGFGAYFYGAGGLSWIVAPNDGKTSGGPVVGVGAGVTHHVERSAFVAFEVGYQMGFQNVTIANVDVEDSSQLLHFGFAIGWDL